MPNAYELSTNTKLDDVSRKSCEKENKLNKRTFSVDFLIILNSILKLRKASSRSVIRLNLLLDSIFFNKCLV
jgi:hypothetical protein